MARIGDIIRIIEMKGEPQYSGKTGIVEHVDSIGQLHGTWGGLAIQPGFDDYEVICCICGNKLIGFGNNPVPVKYDGSCCNACNDKYVTPAKLKNIFGGKK